MTALNLVIAGKGRGAARFPQILVGRDAPTSHLHCQARAAGSAGVAGAPLAAGALWSLVAA